MPPRFFSAFKPCPGYFVDHIQYSLTQIPYFQQLCSDPAEDTSTDVSDSTNIASRQGYFRLPHPPVPAALVPEACNHDPTEKEMFGMQLIRGTRCSLVELLTRRGGSTEEADAVRFFDGFICFVV